MILTGAWLTSDSQGVKRSYYLICVFFWIFAVDWKDIRAVN